MAIVLSTLFGNGRARLVGNNYGNFVVFQVSFKFLLFLSYFVKPSREPIKQSITKVQAKFCRILTTRFSETRQQIRVTRELLNQIALKTVLLKIIIKFRYNARPDWLKQRALSEYRCTESRCHAISPFVKCQSEFSLGFFFYPDVLCNQENEKELLASMDIDHPVRNSTNNTVIESEVSEEVSDENTEPSRKIQTNRDLQTCQPRKSTKLQRRQRRKTPKITQNVQLKFLNERCKNIIILS